MNVYVACALTAVPRSEFAGYALFIHNLASALKENGCKNVKYALVDSDPQLADKPIKDRARLCYLWDREMVEKADVIIADASFHSIGLGIELQIAEARNTPIILCYRKNDSKRLAPVDYDNPDHSRHTLQIGEGYVSLMAIGIPCVFRTLGYSSDEEGIGLVIETIKLLDRGS